MTESIECEDIIKEVNITKQSFKEITTTTTTIEEQKEIIEPVNPENKTGALWIIIGIIIVLGVILIVGYKKINNNKTNEIK